MTSHGRPRLSYADLTDRELLIAGAIACHRDRDRGSRVPGHRPALKRHLPKTERKNVGKNYHGCLRIEVNRSSGLYRKIEGWAKGVMSRE